MIYARNLKNPGAVYGVDPGECALFADPAMGVDTLEAAGFEVLRQRHEGARVVGAAPPRRGPGRPRKDAPVTSDEAQTAPPEKDGDK